jgi:uncharacterized protein YndB with AHSA1/START domain
MDNCLEAHASVCIDASRDQVWSALVNPEAAKQTMFGSTMLSDWHEGSAIVWKGEWEGKPYEDKGVILQLKPERTLQYSYFSPKSGLPDKPENYFTVTIELSANEKNQTCVSLSQDSIATEEARARSEGNWQMVLASLKELVEQ